MLTLSAARPDAELVFYVGRQPAVRLLPRPDGTVLLTHIGASYAAPVRTLPEAVAKAERIVRMLCAGGSRSLCAGGSRSLCAGGSRSLQAGAR